MQKIKRKNDGKRKYKLGRDIEAKQYTNTYGSGFYKNLSQDLKNEMPGVKGFSPTNLKYMSYFYKLYAPLLANRPQVADDFEESLISSDIQTVAEQKQNRQQPVDDFKILFFIPWFHHQRIIDKCKDDMDKALFFVRKTWENNWGRDALLNWLDTDLYERGISAVCLAPCRYYPEAPTPQFLPTQGNPQGLRIGTLYSSSSLRLLCHL